MALSTSPPQRIFSPGGTEARLPGALARRILETALLADRRGYGVPLHEFARILYGGGVSQDEVMEAIPEVEEVTLVDGVVVRREHVHRARDAWRRRRSHADHAPDAHRIADDFARRLTETCPLVRCVALSGSLSSGGFDPRDDVDFNLFVRDGSKYTVYLWCLALSALSSLRNRHKETDEMGDLPFLPKVVCVNVVWEDRQVRPFARSDKWLAYELLMTRPMSGGEYFAGVVEDNAWLHEHFPQIGEAQGQREPGQRATIGRAGAAFFRFLDRNPRALAVVERVARFATIGIHRMTSITRHRKPAARKREEFVNTVKRPYSVYDIPGREGPVPEAAFREA